MREYTRKNKDRKLNDGKVAGGRGRVTDKICDKIQNYFGTAIRETFGNKVEMKRSIWKSSKHMIRDADESLEKQHEFCPKSKDMWCTFCRVFFLKNLGLPLKDCQQTICWKGVRWA